MSEQQTDEIADLLEGLSTDDPATRTSARERLVEIGDQRVIRVLVVALGDTQQRVRWEAAKALKAIADPVAAYALMHALDDDDEDVRWVAGEGLVAMGRPGLLTVLSGLTKRARSLQFCRAAHHVLHELKSKRYAGAVPEVLKALETSEPEVTAPNAAYEALVAMRSEGK